MIDGEEISGEGRLKGSDKILFFDERGEKRIYDSKTVSYLSFIDKGRNEKIFEYKKIIKPKKRKKLYLLEALAIGDINIYFSSKSFTSYNQSIGQFESSPGIRYYIGRNGELEAWDISLVPFSTKRFNEMVKEHYSDCPELIGQIKRKNLEKDIL